MNLIGVIAIIIGCGIIYLRYGDKIHQFIDKVKSKKKRVN